MTTPLDLTTKINTPLLECFQVCMLPTAGSEENEEEDTAEEVPPQPSMKALPRDQTIVVDPVNAVVDGTESSKNQVSAGRKSRLSFWTVVVAAGLLGAVTSLQVSSAASVDGTGSFAPKVVQLTDAFCIFPDDSPEGCWYCL